MRAVSVLAGADLTRATLLPMPVPTAVHRHECLGGAGGESHPLTRVGSGDVREWGFVFATLLRRPADHGLPTVSLAAAPTHAGSGCARLAADGILLTLKSACADGTRHLFLEPTEHLEPGKVRLAPTELQRNRSRLTARLSAMHQRRASATLETEFLYVAYPQQG